MAQNIVKKCFRSADLKSCLNNKFTIDEAFLDILHGNDDLLPDGLENTLRAKLKYGESVGARSEFLRHVEAYYKEQNVYKLCNYLDELSAEKPILTDVVEEIRKTFWEETHIDLTSESNETTKGIPLYEVERLHTGYSSYAQNLDKIFSDFIRILTELVEKMEDDEFREFHDLCQRELNSRKPMAVFRQPVVLTKNRSTLVSELEHLKLWRNCLAYEDLRNVLCNFGNVKLSRVLNGYEQHVIKNVEEILDIYDEECEDWGCYYHLKFKKDCECVIGEIKRLRVFLVRKIGIKKALFDGLRRGCVEICFIMLDEAVNPQQLHAKFLESDNLLFLRELNIHSVILPGAWTLPTRDVTHSKTQSVDIQKIQLDGKSVENDLLDDLALKFPKVAIGGGTSQVVIGVDRLTLPKSCRYGVHRYLYWDVVKVFNPWLVETNLKELPRETSSGDIIPSEISKYKVSEQSLPHESKEKSKHGSDSYTPSIEVH